MARARLTINLDAVRANYTLVKSHVGPAVVVGGVVKANGYGLGSVAVSRALYDTGCRLFFVATSSEAVVVRRAIRSATVPIVTLGGFDPSSSDQYVRDNIVPAIASLDQLRRYRALAEERRLRLPMYVQFCTGMNRLGLCADETDRFFSTDAWKCDSLEWKCAMTHAACADDVNPTRQEAQLARFLTIADSVPKGVQKSFANSSSIFRDAKFHFDMVRPGMCLYGLNPLLFHPEDARRKNPMRRTVTLEAPVLQVRMARKGEFVGYSATFTCARDSILATVGIGYADGLHRALSNTALRFYWTSSTGSRYSMPTCGRMSMDSWMIDLTGIPEEERPRPFDLVSVMCDEQPADDIARMAGTIGYEVLTSLGRRAERIVVGI